MADKASAASIHEQRPRQRGARRPGWHWLRSLLVIAGAAVALTFLDGSALAAVSDSGRIGIPIATKPEKPGRGKPAEENGQVEEHGNGQAHKPAHGNGQAEEHGDSQAQKQGHDDHPGNSAGLGQVVRDGLTDKQANDLAAELRACLAEDKVQDMRRGQLQRLAHAAGLGTPELRDLLAEDDDSHPGRGLGRLVRGGLTDGQADDVAGALRDRLERGDLTDVRLGRLLQAAHACGITTQEFRELLDKD